MKTVLVFKTSVTKKREVRQLRPMLNKIITREEKWNFDLEDCDNILRVESLKVESLTIATTLQTKGFFCEEL